MSGRPSLHNLDQTLSIIFRGVGDSAGNHAHSGQLWPKLQSVALSPSAKDYSVAEVEKTKASILRLQAAGHPIRKLLLPPKTHHVMMEMGGKIEIGEYYFDWPTAFEWED